jgi:hypothetical protein
MSSLTNFYLQAPRLAMRNYSSEAPKKSGGNGVVFAALLGLGVAGGLYYNKSSSVPCPLEQKKCATAKPAFDNTQFKAFKVRERKNKKLGHVERKEGIDDVYAYVMLV